MKKNDIILIAAILIIAFAVLLGQRLWQKNNTKESAVVVVTIDGEEVGHFALSEDCTHTFTLADGSYNTMVIKDGEVQVSEASCPDKICVLHRPIHYSEDSIICLPNELIITIEGGEEHGVDTIAN